MRVRLYLIRHGKTKGNLEKRYIGRTDESLCGEGVEDLQKRLEDGVYAGVEKTDILFVSPMRRCMETAKILLPEKKPIVIPSFREIDFGVFEGKNYRELSGDASYQAWINSYGQMTVPDGESRDAFARRCREGMLQALSWIKTTASEAGRSSNTVISADQMVITMIVHGGTIMSLLSVWGEEGGDYYDYQCENGGGYRCELLFGGNGRCVLRDICSLSA